MYTTSRSATIFSVQAGQSYLDLTLTLWIGLWPMKEAAAYAISTK